MAEEGIDIATERPKLLTDTAVQTADAVITMGCGDECPFYPGMRYEDWDLDDPAGQGLEAVRAPSATRASDACRPSSPSSTPSRPCLIPACRSVPWSRRTGGLSKACTPPMSHGTTAKRALGAPTARSPCSPDCAHSRHERPLNINCVASGPAVTPSSPYRPAVPTGP